MNKTKSSQKGFTLIELLMAMVVSAIVVGGTVMVFRSMVRTHNTEVKITTMQQNLRATMDYMERYIRMAGYDPLNAANAGFTTLLSNQIEFTMDKGRPSGSDIDDDPNGVIDNHWDEKVGFKLESDNRLTRLNAAGIGQTLANNIEVVNFVYLDDDSNMTTNPIDVRSVQVSIIARSGDTAGFEKQARDNQDYVNQQGTIILPAQNDNIRRLMLTADISCRNMAW